jgi:hypothetical protein
MNNADTLKRNESPLAHEPRRLWRSIGAVLAGVVAIFVLSLGTDVVLHATGVYPPWLQPMSSALFLLATAYRIVYGIAGGYLTARLAPSKPMKHALILGIVGLGLSILGAVSTWNSGLGPRWYPLALVATALPCAWLGGKLGKRAS